MSFNTNSLPASSFGFHCCGKFGVDSKSICLADSRTGAIETGSHFTLAREERAGREPARGVFDFLISL
jgi:hypothetical protein